MKKYWTIALTIMVALLGTAGLAFMQEDEDIEVEPVISNVGIEIYRPQPISEIWGDFEVDGTANVPGMIAYQLEMIPLNPDGTMPENGAWIPVTEPRTDPVVDDWLDTIATNMFPDGLYGLRLLVYLEGEEEELIEPATFVVMPVRISNDLHENISGEEDIIDVDDDEDPVLPEDLPFPGEAVGSVLSAPVEQESAVQVTPVDSVESVNIRSCDIQDNNSCPVAGSLLNGQVASALGLSANGTGWYLIQTANGLQGWVSPTVVLVNGDTTQLPLIAPPPPLASTQPSPVARVVPTSIAIQNGRAVCMENFTALVTVTNQGTAPSQAGSVTLQNIHVPSGQVTYTGHASYPALNPGQTYTAPVTVNLNTYYNNEHELRATSEGQTVSTRFTLEQGNCNKQKPDQQPRKPQEQKKKTFKGDKCQVSLKKGASLYRKATHDRLTKVDNGTYISDFSKKYSDWGTWYRIYLEPGNRDSRVWVSSKDIHSRKNACKY